MQKEYNKAKPMEIKSKVLLLTTSTPKTNCLEFIFRVEKWNF